MNKELAASAVKTSPPVAYSAWLWLTSHDINWYVAALTFVYIGMQVYVFARDRVFHRGAVEE